MHSYVWTVSEWPKEDRKPRAALNKAGMQIVMIGSLVVASALLAALLAQGGLFSAHPGLPEHPDGLTTLALVLAILAFLVQVFVFILQTNAANSAVRRSEELNSQTHAVLGKIEANSSATQKVLFAQFDRLLDYVVGGTTEPIAGAEAVRVGEVLEEGVTDEESDLPGGEQDPATAADVQRIVNDAIRSRGRPSFEAVSKKGPSDEDLKVVRHLQKWPTRDESVAAVADLAKLSPLAVALLTRYGTQEIRHRLEGQYIGLLKGSPMPLPTHELVAAGLVREDDDGMMALTERGRELARNLPIGKSLQGKPDWYDEVFGPLLRVSSDDDVSSP
jgi:hypothetical protein